MRKKHLKVALREANASIDALASSNTTLWEQREHLASVNDKLVEENRELRAKLETKGPNRPNRPKLDRTEVAFIKDLVRAGVSRRDVARSFDVNPSTISRIVRGQYHR
ncbi:HTH DNA binding protein [Mycobacterium phage Mundrea]|uniref:Helix-turn-helix DNA-binding protein n=1 Tax=Mycobacterium phage Mundrea TaxID=1897540 RepID=A0A1C9LYJ7_9CAUD|nr:HTH DNA binding protein [Mycobacterium phage Mundrea]AOQ27973.1 helix-turn-helix DNA-binding protein [Mycobacterium phage Mundrea]